MENFTAVFTAKFSETTTKANEAKEDIDELHSLSYLYVPLGCLVLIAILTVTVLWLMRRKRKIDRLRHHLVPFYNFAPGEEDDWETELLESDIEPHTRRDYYSISLPYQPTQV